MVAYFRGFVKGVGVYDSQELCTVRYRALCHIFFVVPLFCIIQQARSVIHFEQPFCVELADQSAGVSVKIHLVGRVINAPCSIRRRNHIA